MMNIALRPNFLGTLAALAARATSRSDDAPTLVRNFDPARETLTLTIADARGGEEILFHDDARGCRIEMQGRTVAILVDVRAGDLDGNSIRFLAA
ncbi:hypothetical protein OG2516_09263 [Oceanicola granulosus HTCC2516]|uniref:Uncharacterized protein n=1 Tax=Oceanicola granulosus (strain ATCC BAA-861 / DSM 15982 / KCTC 12143 / HTCC2516) TaxID=314256 RepID=Q2CDS4_OCEGH|nr:hypothetical protein [Oceanicola granulosus]EAR50776.1 hypothetical protein OG2516_09263 [Oceanicola granulosus HTCC2516]